ncbi:hypothetical protein ASPWEDRAFT_690247 [Aspergillus wentii DTO 134E9]|uniref:Uncharacterized protein n=1 Tax=Aspergillus wentii DTO 134E9 TaxID=1073089 RepID=A0A1L9R8Z5_ASPWE|nr:uncharacterized protein ASPWEDRAFT_690247 [Aspergillus wentii DTO 134E9]OJJ31327.1 hypothetical protein ASPWEDRAFT_690247 [Aspergillus wentii DTO 134E9]
MPTNDETPPPPTPIPRPRRPPTPRKPRWLFPARELTENLTEPHGTFILPIPDKIRFVSRPDPGNHPLSCHTVFFNLPHPYLTSEGVIIVLLQMCKRREYVVGLPPSSQSGLCFAIDLKGYFFDDSDIHTATGIHLKGILAMVMDEVLEFNWPLTRRVEVN